MIEVRNLTKRYAVVTAVDDISFDVKENEVVGFLGPNGAGKSTTLKVLTCFHPASSGTVTVGGRDVFTEPEVVKASLGYLPENVPLYPELRVKEYLDYRAALKRVPRGKRSAAVDRVLDRCKLGDVRTRIIGQLSKGYRQRVGIADALVGDPHTLVLDEPTIGLDPNQIREVRELIRDLGRERTIILSSHILPEVEAVCSRVLIMSKGKIVGQGRPDELRNSLEGGGTTVTVEVVDPHKTAGEVFEKVTGVLEVGSPTATPEGFDRYFLKIGAAAGAREALFDAAVAGGFKLVGLTAKTLSLEDVFVEITTREDDPVGTREEAVQ